MSYSLPKDYEMPGFIRDPEVLLTYPIQDEDPKPIPIAPQRPHDRRTLAWINSECRKAPQLARKVMNWRLKISLRTLEGLEMHSTISLMAL